MTATTDKGRERDRLVRALATAERYGQTAFALLYKAQLDTLDTKH